MECTFIHSFDECVHLFASTQTTSSDKFIQEHTTARLSSLILACFLQRYAYNAHKLIQNRICVISSWRPHTHVHTHTHTHKLSSISSFRTVPPMSPWLCFWLCLYAGRRSPDTHHWVTSLHINATQSLVKNPISVSVPFPSAAPISLPIKLNPESVCRAILKRLMVNHRLRHCSFFSFLPLCFLMKTSDVLFVTALCC